MTIKPGL
jgi:hypothetical protein